MPARASAYEVHDDIFVDEEKVALNLLVEGVWQIDTADISWTGFNPHPADFARIANLWNQIENVF